MSAIRLPARWLPSDWSLEVWGDSMAWLVSPDGHTRLPLREFLERDGWTQAQMAMGNVAEFGAEHDERNCRWRRTPRGWDCEHGVSVTEHPRGYCDQGCCR